jgi:hypothetical protein
MMMKKARRRMVTLGSIKGKAKSHVEDLVDVEGQFMYPIGHLTI